MEKVELNPRLRVEPIPVEVQGRKMLLFEDPDRFTDQTVLMPLEAAVIVQFLDGAHSVRDIQEELMRQSGQLIDSKLIEEMIAQLDLHLLLESPRFFAHVQKLNDDWAREPVRPPEHAGRAYPDDPAELKTLLDGCYTAPDGPGALPGPARDHDLKGIVAPHMDIRDAGVCSAFAFKELAERTDAELFVLFGTGHAETQRLFVLSDKDFQTPLGIARSDRELIDRIRKLRHDRNPVNDYLHKLEHSIEFMVVYLQHALAGRPFRIVPVLTAGTAPSLIGKSPPAADPAFRDFMDALRLALAERGERVCFVAGADLAHLGPRYGDQQTWAPIRMAEEEEIDRAMLAPLLVGDEDGFFGEIAKIGDQRRVCGLAPIYAALAASGAERAQLLKWSYWHDHETSSVVSFASLALY
jgi:hypothetical protein